MDHCNSDFPFSPNVMMLSSTTVSTSASAFSRHIAAGSSTSHLDLCTRGNVILSKYSDSDNDDSTTAFEDLNIYPLLGHTLGRSNAQSIADDSSSFWDPSRTPSPGPDFTSSSSSSATSSIVYDIDYERLIDNLLAKNTSFDMGTSNLITVESSSPELRDSLMIKCLPRHSDELYILLELNHAEVRADPWNPAPHILCAVEREDKVFLCIERLYPYNDPPFKIIANHIDFIRQILEGLTFLHELKITQLSFQDLSCVMVDLGSAPSTCSLPTDFDRTLYPVRYYFTNLSDARKTNAPFTPVNLSSSSSYKHDIQNCGIALHRLLYRIPRIESKFNSLIKAMTTSIIGADDALKLFDTLCKSVDSSVLGAPVATF